MRWFFFLFFLLSRLSDIRAEAEWMFLHSPLVSRNMRLCRLSKRIIFKSTRIHWPLYSVLSGATKATICKRDIHSLWVDGGGRVLFFPGEKYERGKSKRRHFWDFAAVKNVELWYVTQIIIKNSCFFSLSELNQPTVSALLSVMKPLLHLYHFHLHAAVSILVDATHHIMEQITLTRWRVGSLTAVLVTKRRH